MVLPPETDDGLGIILLDSNADTHFSFTNALGMISADQARALDIARAQYPRACWVVVLHHHVVEYPRPAKSLSVRVGTALVNGNWFVRRLKPLAGRAVLLHGHRHIDWIGNAAAFPSSLRAVAGHGGDRRHGHVLLHPHRGGGRRPAPQIAAAATHHRGGRVVAAGLGYAENRASRALLRRRAGHVQFSRCTIARPITQSLSLSLRKLSSSVKWLMRWR